jgi:hypothetical protein
MLITTLILQGCVGDKGSSNRRTSKSSVVTTPTPTPTTPVFQSDESLYWFSAEKVTGTITVNKNSDSVVYMRGQYIHDFLTSKDASGEEHYRKTFCVEADYGGTNKKLKVRAVPIFISNYTTKAIERVLRLDLPSVNENDATCRANYVDGNLLAPPDAAVYSMGSICTSCLGISLLTSTSLKVYSAKKISAANYLTTIPSSKLNLASLALRVDIQSNSTTPESTCTNNTCEAKGFDCCIEGQCVKDASVKASASTDDPAQYAQAMSEYANNPLSFINFPNIFNICANITHDPPPTTGGGGTTPISEAEQRVKNYLADYKCLDKVETLADYSLCLPGASPLAYSTIKTKLAVACGCSPLYTPDEMAVKCPDWGVRPLYKSTVETVENIVDFYCYAPVPENPIGPITNLNVSVSSRSAPHRFYSTAGTNYDTLDKLATNVVQEGEDFYYLDTAGKSSPINGTFNMNSILGRMNVGLSQTQPAKVVNIELGKTYIVSATNGYFTPCTQCAKDSWFQTFTAHPSSAVGNGLRAVGYTTSRDTYSSNTTYGNYEDTKFGRACYIPPTMIPFSHMKNAALQTQRLNRLSTQAAFYVNGYQKDWYGFNKGALIGSFDGVSWFAIGTGRRITGTSNKLFLAINGAFHDLADRTDTIVNIIPDMGNNVAPDHDYDPELTIIDPKQNKAGSCQQYHQCSTDTDCVTKLGWEYSCADVSQMRSKWPVYDIDGKEVVNQEKVGTIFEILQGTTTMGPSGLRCVYRGAGAPCVRDYSTMTGASAFNKKLLTCAPNFYCASLTTNRYNLELVRSVNDFDNILFGMDANVLGRPLDYVTATKSLSATIIANIKNNANSTTLGLTPAQADDFGICRPGKSLDASSDVLAHSTPDVSRRTDFISQVGSCNSAGTAVSPAKATTRYRTCPAIGDDGNYLAKDYVPEFDDYKRMQNSCGAEAKENNASAISPFKFFEAISLASNKIIPEATLALDACLRRPGSVCHTDLDCGPNKMHEEAAASAALKFFGGTEAEQSYWKESMICGQGTPVPVLGSTDYYNYNQAQNRCCREVGKDFTMYTSGSATLIPENAAGSNDSLITSRHAVDNPKANFRYSRYTISRTALSDSTTIPAVTAAFPAVNQWKVINETGSKTCCGGGWIRKFADGTHDWRVKNRFTFDASNFSCLNFRSPLASPDYSTFALDNIVQASYLRESDSFCRASTQNGENNGCMQIPFTPIDDFKILPPYQYVSSNQPMTDVAGIIPATQFEFTRLDTSPSTDPIDGDGDWIQNVNSDVPYQPFPFYIKNSVGTLLDVDSNKKAYNIFSNITFDYGLSIYLPAYIPYNTITKTLPANSRLFIKYFKSVSDFRVVEITNINLPTPPTIAECNAVTNGVNAIPIDAISIDVNERWCISEVQGRPVLNVKAYNGAAGPSQWKYASLIIEFPPLEKLKGTTIAVPGTPYYYLTKLGRLELLGIPQITYEPLYCSNDHDKVVPGIFKAPLVDRATFQSGATQQSPALFNRIGMYDESSAEETSANYGNGNRRFTYMDKIDHPAIFSSKDFTCCTPLGKETASGDKCCSGSAQAASNGKSYCKLPRGTNLNVYFNKFVSNEGVGEDQPGGGLVISTIESETDFIAATGEPKMRNTTFAKLEALGAAYCSSGIVGTGGAFGRFPAEPSSGFYVDLNFPISIVDSPIDADGDTGKFPFDSGYRWNHHYYCK